MATLCVLHLEDVESDAILIEQALRKGGLDPVIRHVTTLPNYQAALDQSPWDVILADHGFSTFTGLDAYRIFRERGLDCPFILVSGHIGEEQAAEAMRRGIHDYVLKDRLSRLVPAVERAIEDARLRSEARRMRAELEQQAENQRLLMEQAPAAIAMFDTGMRYIAASGRWLRDYHLEG